ncbi:MAG: serine/threonine-protein kinase [Myxococcota bacterium]
MDPHEPLEARSLTEKVCERCHGVLRTVEELCPRDGGKLHSVASPESLVGRVIDGKLTLTGVVGKGGMGVVYRARQHSIDREVAVKILHPGFANDTESVRRFLHEARAATRLEHPNVITVFDFGRTDDGLLYIVMELLNGHSLGTEIALGPIAPARAVHLLTQVADAVHHAHERGLVHRDLKPENVILVQGSALRGDFVKVLDFGIAMTTARSYEGMERITRTGAVCGTPAYMSPEQVLGDEIDARSDVYALGVIAYEMLSGLHPLPADTPMRQMLAHIEKPVPALAAVAPHVPTIPALEQAVRHALEKKREQRTASALEFANELVAALGGRDVSSPVLGVPVSPSRLTGVGAERIDVRVRADSTAPPGRDRRGLADTARAAPAPQGTLPKWRAAAPFVAVLGLLAAALVFFATRTEEGRASATGGSAVASSPPLAVPVVHAPDASLGTAVDAKVVAAADTAVAEDTAVAPDVALAQAPEVAPVDAAPAEIVLTSDPVGAIATRDGVALGKTPLRLAPPASGSLTIVLKKAGYRAESVVIGAGSSDLSVMLTALPHGPRGDAPGIVP